MSEPTSAATQRLTWTDDEGTTWGEPVQPRLRCCLTTTELHRLDLADTAPSR